MVKIIMVVFYFILTIIISGGSFLFFSPQFGSEPKSNIKNYFETLDNYSNGEFKNQESFV